MNHHIMAYDRFYFLIGALLLFFATNIYAEDQDLKKESDSVKIQINKCADDFCKCDILNKYSAKYNETDPGRAAYYGKWLYNEFYHSSFDYLILKANEAKANIFLREGNIDSARFFLKKTLTLATTVNDTYSIVQCYLNLATVNEKSGDLKSVIPNLKLAEKYALKMPDPATANYIALKNAYFYDYRGNNKDSALFYFLKTLKFAKKKSENLNVILISLNVALAYVKQQNFKKSLEYMNLAVTMPEQLQRNTDVSKSYLLLGDFFLNYGNNYDIALTYYKKAIAKIKNDSDLSLKGEIYRQVGNLFLKQGMDSVALNYYLLSMDLLKKTKNKSLISDVYKKLGETYHGLAKYDLALINYKACVHTGFTSFPNIDDDEVLIAMADIYMQINNRQEALTYYQKAVDLANQYHSGREMALSKLKMGYYFRSTNPRLNEKYYLSAFEDAKAMRDNSFISNVADSLSHFYQYGHNYKKVYEYNQIIKNIAAKSDKRDDWLSNMKGFLLVYEFEKIEKEKEASRLLSLEELKRQKIYRNFLILISLLLCLLGIVIFINSKRKTRDNLQLIRQKEEIENKNHEIQSQLEEIERISKKLHEADQMKLRFFSNISHEIRTPLTLIMNPLQNLIGSFKGDQAQKRQLDLISSNTNRLKELTDQILDLQKLDSGNLKLNLVKADIILHMKGIISSFEGYCNKLSISLIFASDFSSLHCLFDKDKLTKVVSNLLSNAFKYSNPGSAIKTQLTVDYNWLTLSVKDKGRGIPKEHQEDVFERYYQLETSDTQTEGTGIGLAYVKELVELMNGKIDIKSEINHGTTVGISIPLSEYTIVNPIPCEIKIRPTRQPVLDSQIQRLLMDENDTDDENIRSILVVEDNPDLRMFVGELFKDEFNVIYANNGKEGIKKALHDIPDIIISDIMMPDTDGIKLCSTLKQDELTSHIPIILLTAKDNDENHMEGYLSGADDYIVKPFNSDLLKLKIRNMIATCESIRKQFTLNPGDHSSLSKYADIDKLFLSKCMDVIHKHIDNSDFTVEELSKELSFSKRNLYRKLQALTNYHPAELIKNMRMQHAANLLKTTKMRISEVAQASGYENTAHFSQLFKQQFGVLPSEYKR